MHGTHLGRRAMDDRPGTEQSTMSLCGRALTVLVSSITHRAPPLAFCLSFCFPLCDACLIGSIDVYFPAFHEHSLCGVGVLRIAYVVVWWTSQSWDSIHEARLGVTGTGAPTSWVARRSYRVVPRIVRERVACSNLISSNNRRRLV